MTPRVKIEFVRHSIAHERGFGKGKREKIGSTSLIFPENTLIFLSGCITIYVLCRMQNLFARDRRHASGNGPGKDENYGTGNLAYSRGLQKEK